MLETLVAAHFQNALLPRLNQYVETTWRNQQIIRYIQAVMSPMCQRAFIDEQCSGRSFFYNMSAIVAPTTVHGHRQQMKAKKLAPEFSTCSQREITIFLNDGSSPVWRIVQWGEWAKCCSLIGSSQANLRSELDLFNVSSWPFVH